jgi:hypothetical protein
MPDFKSVPDAVRWKLAAQFAAVLPSVYDSVFRPVIGEKYDEQEQEVWIRIAQISFEIARSLQLPVKNAKDIAESLRTVTAIVFGPEYKGEVIGVGDDGAVVIVKRCPCLRTGTGTAQNGTFNRCMAFSLASQKKINPSYAARFVRAMCQGDRQCEIKIEPEQPGTGKEQAAGQTRPG